MLIKHMRYSHEEIEELLRKAGARTVKPSERYSKAICLGGSEWQNDTLKLACCSLTMQLIAAAGNGNIAEAERLIFREGVDPNTGIRIGRVCILAH
jgi:hypothetical protein